MSERNVRKTKVGKVVSDKMDKTVVVAVEELEQHKLYKKAIKTTVKLATRSPSWRRVRFPRTSAGELSKSSSVQNKPQNLKKEVKQ